jgi:hypothetical protein
MKFDEIKNTNDLIYFFENWIAFDGDDYDYDVNGLFAVIRACLRNLEKRSIEGDFEDLDEVFQKSEIEILEKIVAGYRK